MLLNKSSLAALCAVSLVFSQAPAIFASDSSDTIDAEVVGDAPADSLVEESSEVPEGGDAYFSPYASSVTWTAPAGASTVGTFTFDGSTVTIDGVSDWNALFGMISSEDLSYNPAALYEVADQANDIGSLRAWMMLIASSGLVRGEEISTVVLSYPSGDDTVTYTFTAEVNDGLVTKVTESSEDSTGNISETAAEASFEYDDAGRFSKMTFDLNNMGSYDTTYGYDDESGYLTSVSGEPVTFYDDCAMDESGRVIDTRLELSPEIGSFQLSYDENGRITSVSQTSSEGETNYVNTCDFTYGQ